MDGSEEGGGRWGGVGTCDSGWRVEEGGGADLIVGDALGLGDELGAADPTVAVCEQVLFRRCRPHLETQRHDGAADSS